MNSGKVLDLPSFHSRSSLHAWFFLAIFGNLHFWRYELVGKQNLRELKWIQKIQNAFWGAFAMPRVATVPHYPLMSAPAPAVPWFSGKHWRIPKWLHDGPELRIFQIKSFHWHFRKACMQLRWRTLLPKPLRRKCEDQFLDWALAVRLLTTVLY